MDVRKVRPIVYKNGKFRKQHQPKPITHAHVYTGIVPGLGYVECINGKVVAPISDEAWRYC